MTRARLAAVLAGGVLVAALLLLPLRLAVDGAGLAGRGLAARAVTGSLWAGRLHDARMGGVALGDLDAGLSPVQLLIGRVRIDFSRAGGGGDGFKGALGGTRDSFGIDDLTATLPVGDRFSPLPISTVALDDFSVRFSGGRCVSGEGAVRATVSGSVAGLALAQGLGGVARCDGAALLLPLVGQSGMERLDLRLTADGRYRAELNVRSADPALARRLVSAGFAAGPDGHRLTLSGRI